MGSPEMRPPGPGHSTITYYDNRSRRSIIIIIIITGGRLNARSSRRRYRGRGQHKACGVAENKTFGDRLHHCCSMGLPELPKLQQTVTTPDRRSVFRDRSAANYISGSTRGKTFFIWNSSIIKKCNNSNKRQHRSAYFSVTID